MRHRRIIDNLDEDEDNVENGDITEFDSLLARNWVVGGGEGMLTQTIASRFVSDLQREGEGEKRSL